MIEESISISLERAKELKKEAESEISRIVASFEERVRINIHDITVDKDSSRLGTSIKLNCNL